MLQLMLVLYINGTSLVLINEISKDWDLLYTLYKSYIRVCIQSTLAVMYIQ